MKTSHRAITNKHLGIIVFTIIYILALQNQVLGQSTINQNKSKGYFALENFRVGAEISKSNSLTNSIEAEQRTNSATEQGVNILGDFLLFNKTLALTSGIGFNQSKISISQNNFLASQKDVQSEFDGIKNDPGSYILDDRMYFNIPVRLKWRSGLIGTNKKLFIGSGVNYSRMLAQEAVLAFEKDGLTTDQNKVIEVNAQNQKLDLETQVGVEFSVSRTLILHAAVAYRKGLISPYGGSSLLLNNIGIQTGVYF